MQGLLSEDVSSPRALGIATGVAAATLLRELFAPRELIRDACYTPAVGATFASPPGLFSCPPPVARTLLILKPDVARGGRCLAKALRLLQRDAFEISTLRSGRLAPVVAAALAATAPEVVSGRVTAAAYERALCTGPVVVAALSREGAVGRLLALVGRADPQAARVDCPFSLRANFGMCACVGVCACARACWGEHVDCACVCCLYARAITEMLTVAGTSLLHNACHASVSVAAAEDELAAVFGPGGGAVVSSGGSADPVMATAQMRAFVRRGGAGGDTASPLLETTALLVLPALADASEEAMAPLLEALLRDDFTVAAVRWLRMSPEQARAHAARRRELLAARGGHAAGGGGALAEGDLAGACVALALVRDNAVAHLVSAVGSAPTARGHGGGAARGRDVPGGRAALVRCVSSRRAPVGRVFVTRGGVARSHACVVGRAERGVWCAPHCIGVVRGRRGGPRVVL